MIATDLKNAELNKPVRSVGQCLSLSGQKLGSRMHNLASTAVYMVTCFALPTRSSSFRTSTTAICFDKTRIDSIRLMFCKGFRALKGGPSFSTKPDA